MQLNQEKQKIVDCDGNVLVTANPGTGKTLLLARKYLHLLQKGVKPTDILCLTFTNKAKKEMEERIFELLTEDGINIDLSDLNVHTFHSYALGNLDDSDLVSTNFLRYSIFRYLKANQILNYSDNYLLETVVREICHNIQYLKCFGITPEQINCAAVKDLITDFKRYSKSDLENFLDSFVKIFAYYEEVKSVYGFDYSDMLINFLEHDKIPQFDYVLVDELQDVNTLEADIALKSARYFVAVGDQKQAIFGFQGGSILNFEKFADSSHFILSENFRSTNAILQFARDYFSHHTKKSHHCVELEKLENKTKGLGEKPTVYSISRDKIPQATCELLQQLSEDDHTVAVITRTNNQLKEISKELQNRGIEHSATFSAASPEARTAIVSFLRGLLSSNIEHIRDAMFTPFFPLSLQDAFYLSEKEELSLDDLKKACPLFFEMRNSINTLEDIDTIFYEKIAPVAISYGKEYFQASLACMDAFHEAMERIEHKKIEDMAFFLTSSELTLDELDVEKNIVLTTVHKAKGKQFDRVIYVPSKLSDVANFQDAVIKAILQSKGIDAEEELEEEALRIHFVAFTRAKEQLCIVTDKPTNFVNEFAEICDLACTDETPSDFFEIKKRAYNLFVHKEYDEAKRLLEEKNVWLTDFITNYFHSLIKVSFSALNSNAYEFLKQQILRLRFSSPAAQLGSDVHSLAEQILKEEMFEVDEILLPYKENIASLQAKIQADFPIIVSSEEYFSIPLSALIETEHNMMFTGLIDAVFKNNNDQYLIVDWKSSKNTNYASEHRRQLSVYKQVFSIKHKVPLEKIQVAIGYVGLRKTINDGSIAAELDLRQPRSTSFDTFLKHLQKFLSWRKDVDLFFDDLANVKEDDALLRSILEQYALEKT